MSITNFGQWNLEHFDPKELFPNKSTINSYPPLRIIGPLNKEDQKYYDDQIAFFERLRGQNSRKEEAPLPRALTQKEIETIKEIGKTKTAYQTFSAAEKTADSYARYFAQIDSLETLTRPKCYAGNPLSLALHVPIYLEAKALAEERGPSAFSQDGKTLTDAILREKAKSFLSYIDSIGIIAMRYNPSAEPLPADIKPLQSCLVGTYEHFSQFCTHAAAHAKRIQYDTEFALAETHRESVVLFIDALFTFAQKNNGFIDEIVDSLEKREERYLSLLPLLALYQNCYTKKPAPEIFKSFAEKLPSLTVGDKELKLLYDQLLSPQTNEETVCATQKEGSKLLSLLRGTENKTLNGIMLFATEETAKALKVYREVAKTGSPSYPLFAAALIKNKAISPCLISHPLAPEIKTSLPNELSPFSLQEMANAPLGSPVKKAIQTVTGILESTLFGPLPNYQSFYSFTSRL